MTEYHITVSISDRWREAARGYQSSGWCLRWPRQSVRMERNWFWGSVILLLQCFELSLQFWANLQFVLQMCPSLNWAHRCACTHTHTHTLWTPAFCCYVGHVFFALFVFVAFWLRSSESREHRLLFHEQINLTLFACRSVRLTVLVIAEIAFTWDVVVLM